jgi:hypothetical protein
VKEGRAAEAIAGLKLEVAGTVCVAPVLNWVGEAIVMEGDANCALMVLCKALARCDNSSPLPLVGAVNAVAIPRKRRVARVVIVMLEANRSAHLQRV